MKIDGRLLIVFIIALVLIPGACATTISTGGGSSTAVSGFGSSIGNFAMNGVQTTGFATSYGATSVNIDHWIEDTNGKHAEVSVNVPNADYLNWNCQITPSNDQADQIISASQDSLSAQQWLDVTNANSIQASATARNREGDNAQAGINMGPGTLWDYGNGATATDNNANAYQYAAYVAGGMGNLNAYASNSNGVSSSTNLNLADASVYYPSLSAYGDPSYVDSYASIGNAYGATEITSHAENSWPAVEDFGVIDLSSIYPGWAIQLSEPVNKGTADFVVKRNEFANGASIITTATSSDVNIKTYGMGKDALILEPEKQIANQYGCADFFNSIGAEDLANRGYAVTGYGDSGVSWDKVHKLDDYTVSMIATHGTGDLDSSGNMIASNGLAISKTGDASTESWNDLQPYLTNSNGKNELLILDGCGTFFKNSGGKLSGSDIVENSAVSGGFAKEIDFLSPVSIVTQWFTTVPIDVSSTNTLFMNKFFDSLSEGNTVYNADVAAYNSVGGWQWMNLGGDKTYTLQ